MRCFNKFKLKEIMQAKYDLFIENETWELIPMPENK